MRCRDAQAAMHEVLDGAAPEGLAARLQEHVGACPACARAYRQLRDWDAVLRSADADEPEDAYFGGLARSIAAGVRARRQREAPRWVPSWSFASGLAAACLVLGLALGHVAFPRTVVVTGGAPAPAERMALTPAAPSPVVRTVEKRVEVPVVKWRTRVVTRTAAERPATQAPAVRLVAKAPATVQPATHVATPPGRRAAITYAVARGRAGGEAKLSRADLGRLARRLTADVSTLDEALNTSQMARTLVSDWDSADAALRKTIETAPPAP